MFESSAYTARRQDLLRRLGTGLVLLPGNDDSSMSYQANFYPFRQDSSFLYYLGLDRPGLVGVLDAEAGDQATTIFGDEPTLDDVVWFGPLVPLREQAAGAGVSHTRPFKELQSVLDQARAKGRTIHFLPPYRPEHVLHLQEWLGLPASAATAPPHEANPGSGPSAPLIKAVVAQRSIKTVSEVREIELAIHTTGRMQLAAARGAKEGMTEVQLAGILQGIAVSSGAQTSFPTILTVHGQILHNHAGSNSLSKGQMVLCDCGAEAPSHYCGDMTRTFPVDQHFSTRQREAYDIVLDAHDSAVRHLKPGVPFRDVHLVACEHLTHGLQALGLMQGDVQESVLAGAHALFFQCGLGHMLGLDTHDMENLGEAYVGYTETLTKSTQFGLNYLRLGRPVEPGFVLTVEPGLYFIPELMDQWAAQRKHAAFIRYDRLDAFRDFGGIRIEDDYFVTATGSRLLGNPLPRKATDIEALRREGL